MAVEYENASKKAVPASELIAIVGGRAQPDRRTLHEAGLVHEQHVIFLRQKNAPPAALPTAVPVVATNAAAPSLPVSASAIQEAMNAQLDTIASELQRAITPALLEVLIEMGFTEAVARKALLLNALNTESAAEWARCQFEWPPPKQLRTHSYSLVLQPS